MQCKYKGGNDSNTGWWQLKYFWNFHPEPWGRWTQFDEHIFQMGWFNHQLDFFSPKLALEQAFTTANEFE